MPTFGEAISNTAVWRRGEGLFYDRSGRIWTGLLIVQEEPRIRQSIKCVTKSTLEAFIAAGACPHT